MQLVGFYFLSTRKLFIINYAHINNVLWWTLSINSQFGLKINMKIIHLFNQL